VADFKNVRMAHCGARRARAARQARSQQAARHQRKSRTFALNNKNECNDVVKATKRR